MPKSQERRTLERAIDQVHMTDDRKEWMKDRWLEQVRWFDHKAEVANDWHYLLRIVAICGAILVPVLVSLDTGHHTKNLWFWNSIRPAIIVIGIIVAISVGLDEFFHWGDRWRNYRRTAELLKVEGWSFLEGAGRYQDHGNHAGYHNKFFPLFATKVEDTIRRDVETYLTRIVQEGPDDMKRKLDEAAAFAQRANEAVASPATQGDAGSEASDTGTDTG